MIRLSLSLIHPIRCPSAPFIHLLPILYPRRVLPFLRDAVFTVASGLHELLEGKAKDNNSDFDGERLHKVIKQKGLPDGITGTITFDRDSTSADRNFSRVVYNVYNFQKKDEKFVQVGTTAAGNNQQFKHCKDPPSKCPIIFRGDHLVLLQCLLYIYLPRRLLYFVFNSIHVCLWCCLILCFHRWEHGWDQQNTRCSCIYGISLLLTSCVCM